MASPVDIGAITEALTNKTDTDGANIVTTFGSGILTSGGVDTVIEIGNETLPDGSTKWYRLWASGWLEQGGGSNNTIAQTATYTFLKSYGSYVPFVYVRPVEKATDSGGSNPTWGFISVANITANQFSWACGGWASAGVLSSSSGYVRVRWYANGYLTA